MESQEIRKTFTAFFKEKGLTEQPSSPLVPQGDPTLLFTSAGMVQFKPNFLGLKKNLKNAFSCQKCLRTTDIDNVGFTKRHLTFFEMLGNFSFGNYFKKEAITWAWTYLTEVLKIDKNRLYVSIFKGGIAPRDEEAYNMWAQLIDKNRIYEFGEDDNFWTMGPTGPCGPCSEIYYDFGEDKGCLDCTKNGIACNCGRFVEIWNLVFTQFNRLEDGTLEPLPQKNIDTGMGLERLCMVMQNVDNPFDTDLFLPIINHAKKILKIEGKTAQEISALRIVADHLRASSFLLSEGVLPSNEGRGYILRRLIRRAFRYGKLMGRQTPFMHELVPTLVAMYKDLYPQLVTNAVHIIEALKAEESAFAKTLCDGETRLNELLKENSGKVFSGKEAFNLYETYGFPLELTREILAEKKIKLDEDGFYQAQKEARASSKAFTDEDTKEHVLTLQQLESKIPSTLFVGYEMLTCEAEIFALLDKNFKPVKELKGSGFVVTGRTPFYAECVWQVGDIGKILKDGKHNSIVKDKQKPLEKIY
ncbi:MAG: alanine--tRNA ligase [Elusimicrobiaceae bacterium]|nr:alanine--tRNA ligase [Elusimicrobiaceae bacterium]